MALLFAVLAGGSARTADNAAHPSEIDPEARDFWAFRALAPPAVPQTGGASATRNTIDAFIVERLSAKGLHLAPEADRLTLLRRASFDLVGLPPTTRQIDDFLSDPRSDAYERLIDRLLASPHFGERWGRHWLDAAGYSDITGGDNDAGIIKLSEGKWKYRDYVVRAYNQDLPYEQFVVEQLAGDELIDWRTAEAFTPRDLELLVATGFLRSAADDTDEKELTTPDILNGVLQRTSEVVANNLLGLTLGCAKCHDHKYEPIPQHDYYGLLAAFTPVFNPAAWVPPKQRALADIPPAKKAEAERHNAEVDRQVAELKSRHAAICTKHQQQILSQVLEAKLATLPETIRTDVKTAIETAAEKRSEVQKYLAEKFSPSLKVDAAEVIAALAESDKAQLTEIDRTIGELQRTRRGWGLIQAAYEVGPPPETHVLVRGNHETPGAIVEPSFLAVLSTPAAKIEPSSSAASCAAVGATSGRRLALARWITDWQSPAGGLAARVYVNRVWQHLFGRGIVETSENLGVSGTPPTHPELLEHMACQFVAEGRRVKPLIKSIMMSAAYRQASTRVEAVSSSSGSATSTADPTNVTTLADPGNTLLWRMPLRRIEAEIVRDAILAASGQLDLTLGGPALPLENRPDGSVVIQKDKSAAAATTFRRSLYVLARRNYHLSILNVFDQPAMSTNCPKRQQSAVVLQSLAMLNDEFVVEQAGHFARRVIASAGDASPKSRIDLAFRIALGRSPSEDELAWSEALVADHAAELTAAKMPGDQIEQASLAQLCHMLFNSNEFLYVP